VSEYGTEAEYGVYVYLKGALFFEALRNRLGEERFRTFLQSYFAQHRYGFATAASFQSTAEATCSCDLEDLFDLWVYQGGELPLP
jgi:aminopeptidase N